ncbi:MAG: transposase [Candidatus Bathyarchaeia archaeon]
MDKFLRLPLDTLKLLFSNMDIKVTVSIIEARYANSGKGRPRFSVRSMLLALMFMRFEAIPSVRKLCRRLERRQYAREICEFGDRTPKHNTFSLFIRRAKPENIERLFEDFLDQAFSMGIIDASDLIMVGNDSTFLKAYSRRGRKGGISDRGARVGRADRRSYKLGWRAHTLVSMRALPIAYIVRAANVNDKVAVKPLMDKASRILKRYGKRISHFIADSQYYSEEVFKAVRSYGAEPVIPHSSKVREPLINLYVTKRFRVKGEKRLVELYKRRMPVERAFKASKLELSMEKPKWRGVAKIRMHVAICYACILAVAITAHKIGRPELANNIAAFTY